MTEFALNDLPWLTAQQDYLHHLIQQQRLPHAILLYGHQGVGKHQLAADVFKQVLCLKGNACGQCRACHLCAQQQHPDIHVLKPEENSRHIKIDAVRDLTTKLQQTPQLGSYRCVLIDDAHALNMASSNALLKTLEEPQANTLMILLAEQVQTILATIRSRCQLVHCPRPSFAEGLSFLQQYAPNTENLALLLLCCQGAPLQVIELLAQENVPDLNLLLDNLLALLNRTIVASSISKTLLDNMSSLWLLACLQTVISHSLTRQQPLASPSLQALGQRLGAVNLAPLLAFYDELGHARQQLQTHSSLNNQLLIETLLTKFANLPVVNDTGEHR